MKQRIFVFEGSVSGRVEVQADDVAMAAFAAADGEPDQTWKFLERETRVLNPLVVLSWCPREECVCAEINTRHCPVHGQGD